MKKVLSLLLLLVCIFNLASCAVFPLYEPVDLKVVLIRHKYNIKHIVLDKQEGIIGYVHGTKKSSGDEIYYIYCENITAAKAVYGYVKTKHEAKVSALKLEIEKIEYALYATDGNTASQQGRYYEQYIEKREELKKIENYDYGHVMNVVCYGTKQAYKDIIKKEV